MHDSKDPLNQLTKNSAGLAWAFSVSTLALSVFYDFSYLGALNIDFGEVQTTISDHVRSAIVWLPWGVISIGLIALLSLAFQQLNGNQPTSIEFDSRLSKSDILKIFNRETLLTLLFWVFFAISAISTLNLTSVYYFLFFSGWLTFSMRLGMRVPAKIYFSSPFRTALFFGPLIASGVGMFGSLNAELALSENEPIWRMTYRQTITSQPVTVDVILLRRFSTTTIVATTERKIILVPENETISTERISPPTPRTLIEKIRLTLDKLKRLVANS